VQFTRPGLISDIVPLRSPETRNAGARIWLIVGRHLTPWWDFDTTNLTCRMA